MNTTLNDLIRLHEMIQRYENEGRTTSLRKQIDGWRAKTPENIPRRFDHLAKHGRLPVARVSESGACGSCHMKLPAADALRIRSSNHALPGGQFCGCFLYAPAPMIEENETTAVAP